MSLSKPLCCYQSMESAPVGSSTPKALEKMQHLVQWLDGNVARPAVNAGVVEPVNAAVNAVNALGESLGARQWLPKLTLALVPEAAFGSKEWLVQSISSGLGMGIGYGVAGRIAASGLRKATAGLENTNLGLIASNRTAAQIVGAAALDGLRDCRPGETRLANMLGGVVGLGIMQSGNAVYKSAFSRMIVGGLGGTVQHNLSLAVSQGRLASLEEMTQIAVTGGMMNLVLPSIQRRLFGGRMESECTTDPRTESNKGLNWREFRSVWWQTNEERSQPRELSMTTPLLPKTGLDRIAGYHRERFLFSRAPETTDFASYSDYWATQTGVRKQMRVMNVAGSDTKIVYVERESHALNCLRALKFVEENNIDPKRLSKKASQALIDLKERGGLEAHPLAHRPTPQEMLTLLREVPDGRLIRNLIIYDGRHADEPWLKKTTGSTETVILAEARPNGDVVLFDPRRSSRLRVTMAHEWAHLLKEEAPRHSRLFDEAGLIERTQVRTVHSKGTVHDEAWALVLGEGLLHHERSISRTTAQLNPIRSLIASEALAERLATVPESLRSSRHQEFVDLTKYVSEQIKPIALQNLLTASSQGGAEARTALRLLGELGTPKELAALRQLKSSHPQLAEAAHQAMLNIAKSAHPSW